MHNVRSYDDLKDFLGVSRLNLWSCLTCGPSVLTFSVANSPHYSWGVVLLCHISSSSWLVCRECSNVRSWFINAADSLSHHRRKHRGSSGKVASSVTVHDSLPFDGTSDHKLAPTLGVAPSTGPTYFSVPMSPSSHHQSSFSHNSSSITLTPVAVVCYPSMTWTVYDIVSESRVEVLSDSNSSFPDFHEVDKAVKNSHLPMAASLDLSVGISSTLSDVQQTANELPLPEVGNAGNNSHDPTAASIESFVSISSMSSNVEPATTNELPLPEVGDAVNNSHLHMAASIYSFVSISPTPSNVEPATTNELPLLEVDNDANSNFTQTASLDSSVMISSTASVVHLAISSDDGQCKSVTVPPPVALGHNTFVFSEHNAHKFILLDIPSKILEGIYASVSVLPITQYEVICSSLKQIRFYKAFHLLFPKDQSGLWDDLLFIFKDQVLKRHPHLDFSEINATVLLADGPLLKPQQPHMDYSWETILLPSRNESKLNRMKYLRGSCQIPFTSHLPVCTFFPTFSIPRTRNHSRSSLTVQVV